MGAQLVILGGPMTDIEFAPSSVLREIAQNVRTIMATIKGTVPLDRTFGVDGDFVDMPQPRAKTKFVAEIVPAVEAAEPRVRVVSVTWAEPTDRAETMDGRLAPVVTVETREGVDIGQ